MKMIALLFMIISSAYSDQIIKFNSKTYKLVRYDNGIIANNCDSKCIDYIRAYLSRNIKKTNKYASAYGTLACSQNLKGKSFIAKTMANDLTDICYLKQFEALIDSRSFKYLK